MTEKESVAQALTRGALLARRCWRDAFIHLPRGGDTVMLHAFGGKFRGAWEASSVDKTAKDWYVVRPPTEEAG